MLCFRSDSRVLAAAIAAGLSSITGFLATASGQQYFGGPNDPTITQTGSDDSSTYPLFTTGGPTTGNGYWSASSNAVLAARTAPTAGYAYVDPGLRIRDLATAAFAGDSLTLISTTPAAGLYNASSAGAGATNLGADGYAFFTTKGAAGSVTTINELVMANAGVFFAYNNNAQTLSGNIYLVPNSASPFDGINLNASGGILDTHNSTTFTVTSNISGAGLLRVENSGGTSGGNANIVILSGTNTNTGGVVLDGTSTAAQIGTGPDLNLNSPSALGSGTFTILPYSGTASPGLSIDNTTGAAEVLSTANAQTWNGNFTFVGTNSLEMGGGSPITMGANTTVTVTASTLTEDGPITGSYGLTKAGAGTLILNGSSPSTYAGFTNLSAGTLVISSAASTGTGLTTVSGGTLEGTGSVPGGLTALSGGSVEPGIGAPGTVTIGTALNMSTGAIMEIILSGRSNGELLVSGQAMIGGSMLTILPIGTLTIGSAFTIVDDTSSLPTLGTFANDTGGGIVYDSSGNEYQVNYAANTDGGSIGNDITLTVVAVPEPATAAVTLIATLSLLGRGRRRKTVADF